MQYEMFDVNTVTIPGLQVYLSVTYTAFTSYGWLRDNVKAVENRLFCLKWVLEASMFYKHIFFRKKDPMLKILRKCMNSINIYKYYKIWNFS